MSSKRLLSKEEMSCIPYKGRERLLFISNEQDTFKMELSGFEKRLFTKSGKIFDSEHEQLLLSYEHGSSNSTRKDYFCILTASKKNTAYLAVYLDGVKNKKFRSALPLDSVLKGRLISLDLRGNKINDVIIIPAEKNDSLIFNNNNLIPRIYWSRSQGLLRFDYSDSVHFDAAD